MRNRLQHLFIVAALGILASACSKGGGGPQGAPLTGAAIFNQSCRDCHRINEEGGIVGPDLTKVGARRDREFLDQVLRDPSKKYPGATMPPYASLPPEQFKLLLDYLTTLK